MDALPLFDRSRVSIDTVDQLTVYEDGEPQPHVHNGQLAQQGRDAWTYIHTSEDDPETTLQRFEAMIPNYGCDCPRNYQRIKEQNPPDLSSRDALWVWGVMLHNLVNEKLAAAGDRTKRVLSIAEARAIWNRPEPAVA